MWQAREELFLRHSTLCWSNETVQKSYDPNLRKYHYDSDSSDENSDRYNDIFAEEDGDDVECNQEHNQMEQSKNRPLTTK